jgi:hypothetical protein
MGTYREHRYTGAPLAKVIEYVTTHTHVDVLVGVSSATETASMLKLTAPTPLAAKVGYKR